ncbi:MAG: type I-E CRISPR-associated protein Cas6/Cse3/CasE [Aquabacterium sp.]
MANIARHDVVMDAKKRAEDGMASADSYGLMREACASWLSRQGERHGFEVEAQSLWVDGYLQHVVKDGKLRFSTVDYRGVLKVTDPVSFTSVLWHGLGHAKAFGCGLMLVRLAGADRRAHLIRTTSAEIEESLAAFDWAPCPLGMTPCLPHNSHPSSPCPSKSACP